MMIQTGSSICTEQVSIESYVNYYALDLQNVIDQRRSIDNRFTAGQLWYIVNSLVDLSLYLQSSPINTQNLRYTLGSTLRATFASLLKDTSKSTSTTALPVRVG